MTAEGFGGLNSALPIGDRKAFGDVILRARKKSGLSQKDLETQSRVPQGKISRIERGVAYPTFREVDALADALTLRVHLVVLE
jgi:transcriptional regulator with XRE-family HTH domain